MARLDTKQKPTVTVRIERGPVLSAQKVAWRKFWQRQIADVKNEAKNE